MAGDDVMTEACGLSVDDVKALTVPKLKAELTRLNQPIGHLKRKPQFVAALTAYIEQQQPQQDEEQSSPTDHAENDINDNNEDVDATVGAQEGDAEAANVVEKSVSLLSSTAAAAPDVEPVDTESGTVGVEISDEHAMNSDALAQETTAKHTNAVEQEMEEGKVGGADNAAANSDGAEAEVIQDGQDTVQSSPQQHDTAMDVDARPSMQQQEQQPEKPDEERTLEQVSATTTSPRASRKRASKAAADAHDGGEVAPQDGREGGGGGGDRGKKHIAGKSRGRGGGDGDGDDDNDGETPDPPRSKRSRRSSSSRGGGKKTKETEQQEEQAATTTAHRDDDDPPVEQAKDGDKGQESEEEVVATAGGATGGEKEAVVVAEAQAEPEPMDEEHGQEGTAEEQHAPSSEPSGAEPMTDVAITHSVPAGGHEGRSGEEGQDVGDGEGAAAATIAVNPVTVRVDNFVRPFTAPQAKKLLEDKAGAPVLEDGFWMDSIKTHCYATFDGQEAADRAIAALQGLQWPERSFKRLEAKMGDVTAKEAQERDEAKRSGRKPVGARLKLGPRVTPTTPTAEAAAAASTVAGGMGAVERTNGALAGNPRAAGSDGASPLSTTGATGTLAAAALAAAGSQVRGRGSVQAPGVAGREAMATGGSGRGGGTAVNGGEGGRIGGARGEEKQKQQGKEEEEDFVLDNLFRKTKASPSLYWLPLSEEEVGERKKKMKDDGVGPRTTPMPADHISTLDAGVRNGSRGGGGGGGWGGGAGRRGYGGGGGGGGGFGNRYGHGDQYYNRGRGGRRR